MGKGLGRVAPPLAVILVHLVGRFASFGSVSTLQNPCSIQGYDACRKNELETGYDILATEHKCHIPIALKRKIGQSPHLPVCDNNVTLEAIRLGKED